MAENKGFGALGLTLLGLAFFGTAVGVAYLGHLSSERILDGTFAAAAQAALDVVVVGVVVHWYRWRSSIREEKTTMLRELSRILEKVREANFLMNSHKSARTWTEQTRELVMLIPRIDDLREAAIRIFTTPAKRSVLDRVKADLEKLKDEYWERHGDVDTLGKLGSQWDAILAAAPRSKELVVSDKSPLLKGLCESIGYLNEDLHR
jgi:hypothetical protein